MVPLLINVMPPGQAPSIVNAYEPVDDDCIVVPGAMVACTAPLPGHPAVIAADLKLTFVPAAKVKVNRFDLP
jgi:hypothetical protein